MSRRASSRAPGAAADPRLRDRAVGCLLGTFVGDALGMPFEGRPSRDIPQVVELEDARLGRGTYTDDTQMTIAVAESLLEHDRIEPDALAAAFLARFEPGRGYGGGTRRVFDLWNDGVPVAQAAARVFDGEGSMGNGAAMRVAPVGIRFYDDAVLVRAEAARSAQITHAHPLGIDGAVAQAAAVAAAVDDDDPHAAAALAARSRELRQALAACAARCATTLSAANVLGAGREAIGADAVGSVAAAVTIGARAQRFDEAVTVAVRCGGDTDTVAAMAGAIAGARFGAQAIPVAWRSALEDGPAGRSHVERLGRELGERASRAATTRMRPR